MVEGIPKLLRDLRECRIPPLRERKLGKFQHTVGKAGRDQLTRMPNDDGIRVSQPTVRPSFASRSCAPCGHGREILQIMTGLECTMKLFGCARCASGGTLRRGRLYRVHILSFVISLQSGETPQRETVVDLFSDIQVLLQKYETDPMNSYRYASLILDINPPTSTSCNIYDRESRENQGHCQEIPT